MKKRIIAALFLAMSALPLCAQQVEFNYEGRVSVDSLPFNGEGKFKFAIVNEEGTLSLWSNDETSQEGQQPDAAVIVGVTDGIFNVVIGNSSRENMAEVNASLFNSEANVFLRVWFTDCLENAFEHMRPDRKITNPALLGSQSLKETNIYVDPSSGDDRYSGLNPSRPKQTIQSAWDAMPPSIRSNITINLAGGVYREEVLLSGRTVIGSATISIIGNESNPQFVRITGADAEDDTTPLRDNALHTAGQQNLYISGVLIDYCKSNGLYLTDDSKVQMHNSKFFHNGQAAVAAYDSVFNGYYIEADATRPGFGPYPYGVFYSDNSKGKLTACHFHDLDVGVYAIYGSLLRMSDTTIERCNIGINVEALSIASFSPPDSLINGCTTGINGWANSMISHPNDYVDYGTNTLNISIDDSTKKYH